MKFNDDISTSGPVAPQDVNISDHFTGYKKLPSNGYSRLFRAQRYGQWYMLKGLKPEYAADPQYTAMLAKEFALTVELNHPNIVRALNHEQDAVVGDCIVMEYVDGRTLDDFLKENPSQEVRKLVVKELLFAMDYFHRKQVVHQDLKPSNILITHDGNHVKIIDFGLSDSRRFAILKEPAYTQSYAAPEQLSGDEVDNRTDIYAFGLILKQLFPSRYGNVVRKCLQPLKEKRFQSADAVMQAVCEADFRRKWFPPVAFITLVLVTALCASVKPVSWVKGKIEDYRILHSTGDPSLTVGSLSGLFSVAPDRQVRFSQGNLQYCAHGKHRTADGVAPGTWRFAENQYDIIGEPNSNASPNYEEWIDLFGFGTSGWNSGTTSYDPWDWEIENIGYYPGGKWENSLTDSCALADWGLYNAISNGGDTPGRWRTLTKDEAAYLFHARKASTVNGIPNARFAKASVNNVNGLILFPDQYKHPDDIALPETINIDTAQYTSCYSASQWKKMENAGAVFLPEAGVRGGLEWLPGSGHYWCSTACNSSCAYDLGFGNGLLGIHSQNRSFRLYGNSVRLVQDADKK